MPMATKASATHVNSQESEEVWSEAMAAAPSAVMPMATPPRPGTAVKEPARSMVSRMKRRLSRAWSSMATGVVLRERSGSGSAMTGG